MDLNILCEYQLLIKSKSPGKSVSISGAGGWAAAARPAVTPRAREEIFRQFWFDSIYVLETQNIPILIWRISYFSLFCATGVRTTVDVRDTTRSKKTFVNGIFSKSVHRRVATTMQSNI